MGFRKKILPRAKQQALTDSTRDAYSSQRYRSWGACVRMLAERRYTASQIEAILRSKYTRWAADDAGVTKATAKDLADYLTKIGPVEVAKVFEDNG